MRAQHIKRMQSSRGREFECHVKFFRRLLLLHLVIYMCTVHVSDSLNICSVSITNSNVCIRVNVCELVRSEVNTLMLLKPSLVVDVTTDWCDIRQMRNRITWIRIGQRIRLTQKWIQQCRCAANTFVCCRWSDAAVRCWLRTFRFAKRFIVALIFFTFSARRNTRSSLQHLKRKMRVLLSTGGLCAIHADVRVYLLFCSAPVSISKGWMTQVLD